MNVNETKVALQRLSEAIPPPPAPLHASGVQEARIPQLPDDAYDLIRVYGSGSFQIRGSDLVVLLNPYEQNYSEKLDSELNIIRELKEEQGDSYIPYDIFPHSPGLLMWGWGEGRKHFFWYTEGPANDWPVIALYDIEISTRFEMNLVSFLQKLLCGELDCDFIGRPGRKQRLSPTEVTFQPRVFPL